MISLTDRIGTIGVVIGSPKQTCACCRLLAFKIFRIAYEMRIRGFMNHTDNAFAFHRGKIRPHHVVMRKIHHVAGGKGARRNQKKQGCDPEDGQLHYNRKSKRIYRAGAENWQEHLFASCKILSATAPWAGHPDCQIARTNGPQGRGYSAARSESSFKFRNNFLSCDVTSI